MKKIVGTIAAIALAASSAFAGVNVGMGFSRAIFTPFAYDGADARMDISTSWGAEPRIGGSISGSSDDCGVVGDFKFDGGNLAVNDNAYVWVKPFSWLTLNIGQSFDDTLRGNACFGMWDWLRIGAGLQGEDVTFTRISGNSTGGAYLPLVGTIIKLDPIEGLHVGIGLPIDGYTNQKMEDVFVKAQFAAGYTIDGIGQIKAQWIGMGKNADDEVEGQIEAAFCLKAVENMTLDIGFRMQTVDNSGFGVSAFWSMPFDALRVNVVANIHVIPEHKVLGVTAPTQTALTVGAGVDYDLGNGLGVSADFRFSKTFVKDFDIDPVMGFGAWINKGIANGQVGVGAQVSNKTTIRDFAQADDINFAIPVRVQCFF